jgi:hypothetical protein
MSDMLSIGQKLMPGQFLQSRNGFHKFFLQDDGNLVIYSCEVAAWASSTFAIPQSLIMQSDGNLVLYGTNGNSLWDSHTAGQGESCLLLQDDRNLVVYKHTSSGPVATWNSQTGWSPALRLRIAELEAHFNKLSEEQLKAEIQKCGTQIGVAAVVGYGSGGMFKEQRIAGAVVAAAAAAAVSDSCNNLLHEFCVAVKNAVGSGQNTGNGGSAQPKEGPRETPTGKEWPPGREWPKEAGGGVHA